MRWSSGVAQRYPTLSVLLAVGASMVTALRLSASPGSAAEPSGRGVALRLSMSRRISAQARAFEVAPEHAELPSCGRLLPKAIKRVCSLAQTWGSTLSEEAVEFVAEGGTGVDQAQTLHQTLKLRPQGLAAQLACETLRLLARRAGARAAARGGPRRACRSHRT